jgi:diadenosine tetraphosphatase ApaH/serine/threonine PP2A family protein phosphatase
LATESYESGQPRGRDLARMRIAILTDIHANREALQAVLADAGACAVDRFAILGDTVGYGPDPGWCLDKVADLVATGAICVKGNHDDAAVTGPDASFRSDARAAILWTAAQLTATQKAFLATLPMRHSEEDVLYVHASAHSPADWIYVTGAQKAMASFRVCTERLIVCGHVHVPALMHCDRGGDVRQSAFPFGKPIPLLRSRRWLAVVGSVGQPRDGSPLAGYAILDLTTNELTFRRVPYDTAATVQKLRAAGLPEALALRLIQGD